jgi:hypothetical protein
VLDLYHRRWKGRKLGKCDYVVCADDKTSIQACVRKHPTSPPGAKRAMRVEHEYARGGALAYLAAWDVHRGKVYGRCEPTTGIDPFGRLVAQVMAAEPYASARRVFWVVDNGSSHRGQGVHRPTATALAQAAADSPARPRILAQPGRDLLLRGPAQSPDPNDFADLDEVEVRLLAFQAHYEQIATPFEWKFTRKDLNALLARTAGQTLDSAA